MKKIFSVSLLILGLAIKSQSIGNSPYAAFGIGDVKYDNTTEISSMGGISTAYNSDFGSNFNFKNPAANENLQFTSLRVEVANENNFFKSNYNAMDVTKHSTYLSNISISFPLSEKIKFGVGYQPYSTKKYHVVTSEKINEDTRLNNYNGEGTLNTLQAAFSYQVSPSFALGLRTNYYFGHLTDLQEVAYSNAELVNGKETINNIRNFNFTLGTIFQKKHNLDYRFTLGATATIGNTSDMTTEYKNSTYFYNTYGLKNYVSEIETKNTSSKNFLPFETSLGIGYGLQYKWFFSSQLDYKKGETIQFLGNEMAYKDSYKLSAGGWFLPNTNNFRNYFERVVYRYGAYYEQGNLYLNNKQINRLAITLGATFPFKNSSANRLNGIDLGVELGKRGTLENNLINQNFINVKVGINFADKWFMKRLYN